MNKNQPQGFSHDILQEEATVSLAGNKTPLDLKLHVDK